MHFTCMYTCVRVCLYESKCEHTDMRVRARIRHTGWTNSRVYWDLCTFRRKKKMYLCTGASACALFLSGRSIVELYDSLCDRRENSKGLRGREHKSVRRNRSFQSYRDELEKKRYKVRNYLLYGG